VKLQYQVTTGLNTYRLVLISSEASESYLQVYIEICYELYQGDFHFKVRKVGSVERNRASDELAPLLRLAFMEALMWRPTSENIWE
jgi:hypothetical protein